MPRLDANDIAARLLNRPISATRVRKLHKLIDRSKNSSLRSEVEAAVYRRGGPMAVAAMRERSR